jgi:hypothetical protein
MSGAGSKRRADAIRHLHDGRRLAPSLAMRGQSAGCAITVRKRADCIRLTSAKSPGRGCRATRRNTSWMTGTVLIMLPGAVSRSAAVGRHRATVVFREFCPPTSVCEHASTSGEHQLDYAAIVLRCRCLPSLLDPLKGQRMFPNRIPKCGNINEHSTAARAPEHEVQTPHRSICIAPFLCAPQEQPKS